MAFGINVSTTLAFALYLSALAAFAATERANASSLSFQGQKPCTLTFVSSKPLKMGDRVFASTAIGDVLKGKVVQSGAKSYYRARLSPSDCSKTVTDMGLSSKSGAPLDDTPRSHRSQSVASLSMGGGSSSGPFPDWTPQPFTLSGTRAKSDWVFPREVLKSPRSPMRTGEPRARSLEGKSSICATDSFSVTASISAVSWATA